MGQAGVGGGEPGAWLDEQRQHSREFGGWLREQQREDRFWSRAEMARQLFAAAHANGDAAVPGVASISSNIYRWERGAVAPGERYRLYYCKAFGIESPKSHGVTGRDVNTLMAEGRYREIAEYCLRDVKATVLLYQVWKERLAGIK